jgi:hypothetical protein
VIQGDLFRVALLHSALMRDRYPTDGAAVTDSV